MLASLPVTPELIPRDEEPQSQSADAERRPAGDAGPTLDFYEHAEPNPPPPALMRRRFATWIWLLLALALAGFIALVMVLLSQ